MSVLALLTMSMLVVLNYRIARDFRYPPVLMSAVWLIIMSIYYISPLEINKIGVVTVLIFISTILAFSSGGLLALAVPERRRRTRASRSAPLESLTTRPRLKAVLLALSLVMLPLMIEKAIQLVSESGAEFFFVGLRWEVLAEGSRGYGHLGYVPLLSFFTTFVYAIEPRTSRGERLQYCFSFLLSLVYAALTTGRSSFYLLLVVLMGVYLMKGSFKPWTFLAGTVVFLASFAFLGIAMGKGGDLYASWSDNFSSLGESALTYAEGPIPAFDQVVRKEAPLEYGRNTFLGPLNIFRKLAGKPLASAIQEEVDIPFPTNVYTGIHPVYKDFGLVGVILAFAAIGAVSTHFYVRGLAGDPLYIFYYSLGLFPLLFMVFSDQYFVPMVIWVMYGLAAYLYFRTEKGRAVTVLQST